VEAHQLDLGDLGSVRSFASLFLRNFTVLDILINNAGISGGPRRVTAIEVLTGSTNFSVFGVYVNANHVLVF
jgi:NAD(P)-dependent dehydrogenase (short-subunit alcohol dehydrogenase family)